MVDGMRAVGFADGFASVPDAARAEARASELHVVGDITCAVIADACGAAMIVTLQGNEVACAGPAFRPPARSEWNRLTVAGIEPDPSCPHCDVVVLETRSGIPLSAELDLMAVHRPALIPGAPLDVSLALVAQSLQWWPDEETFLAEGSGWSPRSVLPIGRFSLGPGAGDPAPDPAAALFHGSVRASAMLTNQRGGGTFGHLEIDTADGLLIDVLVDPELGDLPPSGATVKVLGRLGARLPTRVVIGEPAGELRADGDPATRPAAPPLTIHPSDVEHAGSTSPTLDVVPFAGRIIGRIPAGWAAREELQLVREGSVAEVVLRSVPAPPGSDPVAVADETDWSPPTGGDRPDPGPARAFGTRGWRQVWTEEGDHGGPVTRVRDVAVIDDRVFVADATVPEEPDGTSMADAAATLSNATTIEARTGPVPPIDGERRRRSRRSRRAPGVGEVAPAPSRRLQVTIPDGWRVQDWLFLSPEEAVDVWVTAHSEQVDPAMDTEGFARTMRRRMARDRAGYQEVGDGTTTAFGGAARHRTFTWQSHRGETMIEVQQYRVVDGRGYRGGASAPAAIFEAWEPQLASVLARLDIDPVLHPGDVEGVPGWTVRGPLLDGLSGGGFGLVDAARDAAGRRAVVKTSRPRAGALDATVVPGVHHPQRALAAGDRGYEPTALSAEAAAEVLRREHRLLVRAGGHALLPSPFGFVDHGSTFTLVMERVEGRPPRTVGEVARVLFELGDAAAHGILDHHGDLKPEHVVIETDDRLRLLDPAPRLDPPLVAYTPEYNPLALQGPAADVYAVAVMLYEVLTGTAPFSDRRFAKVGEALDPIPPLGRGRPDGGGSLAGFVDPVLSARSPDELPLWATDLDASTARLDQALRSR